MTIEFGVAVADVLSDMKEYERKLKNGEMREDQPDCVYTLVQTNSNNEVKISDESIAFCVARCFL